MRPQVLLFLWISAVLIAFAAPADARQQGRIAELIGQSSASTAFWAVEVTDLEGRRLEGYNPDRLIRPASVQKLLTSSAILYGLGPEYRFQTLFCATGTRRGETWTGDLLIRGSGDPTINDDFHPNPLFLFEKWAELLSGEGVRIIEGDLIADESLFDDQPWPRGWEWDDLSYYYAVKINPLSFNKNVVNLEVRANGPPGTLPEISWFPFNTPYVTFVNEQTITPRGTRFEESYRRLLGSNTILLRSSLPEGFLETEPLSVADPGLYFIDSFRRYLEQRGVVLNGRLITRNEPFDPAGLECGLTDRHVSPPLSQIMEQLNRESDNYYAEMLLKTLAVESKGPPGTTEAGLEIVGEFLESIGLDTRFIRMRDASGMAPANLVRVNDVNRLLAAMRGMEQMEHFRRSLAVAGVSGTLSHRFHGSPVRGNFSGKSGFVSGVRTLAGYLTAGSGEELIVTIATNNYTVNTGTVDRVHQRILEYLFAEY